MKYTQYSSSLFGQGKVNKRQVEGKGGEEKGILTGGKEKRRGRKVNKTNNDIEDVSFKLLSHKGKITVVSHDTFSIPAGEFAEGTLFIEVNASALSGDKDKVVIGVFSKEEQIETTRTAFLGPRSYK